MSGWSDFSAFAKVAKNTLAAAQKKIDAVLDIKEQNENNADSPSSSKTENLAQDDLQSKNDENFEADASDKSLTSAASLKNLQDDFFAAFGLSSLTSSSSSPSKNDQKTSSVRTLVETEKEDRTNEDNKENFFSMGESFSHAGEMESGWSTEELTVPVDASDGGNYEFSTSNIPGHLGVFADVDISREQAELLTPMDLLTPTQFVRPDAHLTLVEDDDEENENEPDNGNVQGERELVVQETEGMDVSGFLDTYADRHASTNSPALLSFSESEPLSPVHSASYRPTETNFANIEPMGVPSPSLSSSSTEKNSFSAFVDSTLTATTNSSSMSNEKSQDTLVDEECIALNLDKENAVEEDTSSKPRLFSFHSEDSDNENLDETTQAPSEAACEEPMTNIENISSQMHSDILQLQKDGLREINLLIENHDFQKNASHEKADLCEKSECEIIMGESFVQLSRSASNNGEGTGSGHSPTQAASGSKSSETSDEILDEAEATTCSDVEIISTPPYDTVSERSSRSGVVLSRAAEWHYQQQPLHGRMSVGIKDRKDGKKTHRRVGSDQSVASFESVPTSVGANTGISRSASFTVQDFEKKLSHLSELLEARERKLLDIAKENAQLADENEQLRSELQQLHTRISRDTNMDAAQRELSERLSQIERKYETVCKERDGLKRKCDNLEKEVATRITPQQLKEKEEQIADLMAEGEKLSKQELKQANVIKKLREKEKDFEKQVEFLNKKLKDAEDLRQKLKQKDEQELKYDEVVYELKTTVSRQEKAISKLQSELEDTKEKCLGYKTTLDAYAKEIADLSHEKSNKESEIQKLVTKAAESKESELRDQLENVEREWLTERQNLQREVQNVRLCMSQDADDYQRREQSLRWEISQLQKKVQDTDDRNQELAESIATATKPLLRQLDSIQLSFRTQQANWERVEKSLYDRITEAERVSSIAVEKEQQAQSSTADMRQRLSQLEKQCATLQKEKHKLEIALTKAQTGANENDVLRNRLTEELQNEKALHQQALDMLNKDKELLNSQFEYEKQQLKEQLKRLTADYDEKLHEKDQLMSVLRQQQLSVQDAQKPFSHAASGLIQPLSLRISSESPPLSTASAMVGRGRHSRTPSLASVGYDEQTTARETYNDWWAGDTTGGGYGTLLEKLRSRLQQREGELAVLRDEIRTVQQSRDSLAVQMVTLSNKTCELEQQVQEAEELRKQHKELDDKYQALLQIYGEQIERNEELQLDLDDVKAMFKQQLDTLLQRPS